jgi:D-xylose transport system substrate-binding protein
VHLGRQAAVKVLSAKITGEDIEPFRVEARTIGQLAHPNIVQVLDFGIEDGTPYLVMEYAPGGTLRQRLPQRTPLAPATILPYIQQVASALQYAHEQHLIHRDIKPENMLLNARGEVLLSDFGIAVLAQSSRYQSTQDAAGTLAYMAPEQIEGHPRPASDQYALGIVAYEWLTGARPFQGSLGEVVAKHIGAAPPPLREKAPYLPPALEEVVLIALAKDPKARFASVGAFAQAFRLSIETQPPETARPGVGANVPPTAHFTPPSTVLSPQPVITPQPPPAAHGPVPAQAAPSIPGTPPATDPGRGLPPTFQEAYAPPASPSSELPRPPIAPYAQAAIPAAVPSAPQRGRAGLLAFFAVLAVIVVVASSLGVLGAAGSGPLASLFHQGTGAPGSGTPGTGTPGTTGAVVNGRNCTKVGVLLPEMASSPRWEAYDHPLLVQQLEQQGFSANNIDYANANSDASVQQQQAEADLTRGDCILIVAPHDSGLAASIVTAAKQQNVPVIAYDRFIYSDDLNYYVSFDNVKVGELQGQYIADHYRDAQYGVSAGHNNIAFINGSPTDNNATLFANGARQVLDPMISAGTLHKVYEQFTPNWDPSTAETEMEAALTVTANNIQLVLSANDDMGGAAIQALAAQNLAGKVLVTGQDATVGGLQRILVGTQAMTVYRPIIKEATAAAQLAAALRDGKDVFTLTQGATIKNPQSTASIPAMLETPETVDKSNMASTVIADGWVTSAQLCTGLPAGTDTGGICT